MSHISFAKDKFIPTSEVSLSISDNFLSDIRGYQVFTFLKTVNGGKPVFWTTTLIGCYQMHKR